MKILDLYCKAGGVSVGLKRAFPEAEITGVDIAPQPNYPFIFVQANALSFPLHGFDFVWASPPCQFASGVQNLGKARNKTYPKHPNLIPETRALLIESKIPYIIENVAAARKHLIDPVMLCGTYFDLKVYRHRYFESSVCLKVPIHSPHKDRTPSAGNGVSPKGFISVCGTGGVRGMNSKEIIEYWSMAMGIDWMTRAELAEAIPPSYAEYLGRQIRQSIFG